MTEKWDMLVKLESRYKNVKLPNISVLNPFDVHQRCLIYIFFKVLPTTIIENSCTWPCVISNFIIFHDLNLG